MKNLIRSVQILIDQLNCEQIIQNEDRDMEDVNTSVCLSLVGFKNKLNMLEKENLGQQKINNIKEKLKPYLINIKQFQESASELQKYLENLEELKKKKKEENCDWNEVINNLSNEECKEGLNR